MTIFSRHPVDSPIGYGFGAGGEKWGTVKHLGVDYKAAEGTPVYAPASGTVVRATDQASPIGNPWEQIPGSSNNGNHVIIRHDAPHQATHTLYAHLSRWTVQEGQHVNAGDLLGYVGNTGYSFGAHLHWEMFIDYSEGQYPEGTFYGRVDPLDYFTTATVVPINPGGQGSAATIAEQEEIDMAAVDILMARLEQIVGWVDGRFRAAEVKSDSDRNMLAGFVRDVVVNQGKLTAAQIDAKLDELTKPRPAPKLLLKGDGEATVFALEDKRVRPIAFEEYAKLRNEGAVLLELKQDDMTAIVKE